MSGRKGCLSDGQEWQKAKPLDGVFRFSLRPSATELDLLQLRVKLRDALQQGDVDAFNQTYKHLLRSAVCFDPLRVLDNLVFADLLKLRALLSVLKSVVSSEMQGIEPLKFQDSLSILQKKYADPEELQYFPRQVSETDFHCLEEATWNQYAVLENMWQAISVDTESLCDELRTMTLTRGIS